VTRALGWPDDLRTGNAIYQPVEIGGTDIDRLMTFPPGWRVYGWPRSSVCSAGMPTRKPIRPKSSLLLLSIAQLR